jgi:hypothetical protein
MPGTANLSFKISGILAPDDDQDRGLVEGEGAFGGQHLPVARYSAKVQPVGVSRLDFNNDRVILALPEAVKPCVPLYTPVSAVHHRETETPANLVYDLLKCQT